MKIIFMPFINDNNAVNWVKDELKANFLNLSGIKDLQAEITALRTQDGHSRRELHNLKLARQVKWLAYLANNTASVFESELKKLQSDDADPEKTTIVAALPEFFWRDLNDNNKHEGDIVNYHKPFYSEIKDVFFSQIDNNISEINDIVKLTKDYTNLIFFCGTVIWKEINDADSSLEKIYNTLPIIHSGGIKCLWSKRHISGIDGFCDMRGNIIKKKLGFGTGTDIPVIKFNNLNFLYDICLDFTSGKDACGNSVPLSSQLFTETSADVNVLIAGGMPIDRKGGKLAEADRIKSGILLRCDAYKDISGIYSEARIIRPTPGIDVTVHPVRKI